jgi:FMN phosphatase YigB (HAD superfamily)
MMAKAVHNIVLVLLLVWLFPPADERSKVQVFVASFTVCGVGGASLPLKSKRLYYNHNHRHRTTITTTTTKEHLHVRHAASHEEEEEEKFGESSSSSIDYPRSSSQSSLTLTSSSPLPLVVTFDLDNTLFPIREVVQEANAVMLQAMQDAIEEGLELQLQLQEGRKEDCRPNPNNNNDTYNTVTIAQPQHKPCLDRFTAHMKDIRQEYRAKAQDREHDHGGDGGGGAISYSELRRLAVVKELEHCLGVAGASVHDVEALSHTIFEAWLRERHLSAERNLFPHTVEALAELSQLQFQLSRQNDIDDADGDDQNYLSVVRPVVVIGAITNGRGCPLAMTQTIQHYFDFTVSGEDSNVFPHRKPSRKIFQVALEKANQILQHKQQGYIASNDDNNESSSSTQSQPQHPNNSNTNRMLWVHVGDDLTNDVGAAASCGAHSIWMTPKHLPTLSSTTKNEFWSTASPEEVAARQASAKEAIATGQVAAQISCMSELCGAISNLLSTTDSTVASRTKL